MDHVNVLNLDDMYGDTHTNVLQWISGYYVEVVIKIDTLHGI